MNPFRLMIRLGEHARSGHLSGNWFHRLLGRSSLPETGRLGVTLSRMQLGRSGRRLTRAAETALANSPLQLAASLSARQHLCVLAYHGVPDAQRFTAQLDWLTENANIVSIEELRAATIEGKALPKRPALLTFDDGDPSIVDVAAPVLRERGIPAVAYVIPGLIDTDKPFWWTEIAMLVQAGAKSDLSPTALVSKLKRVHDKERRRIIDDLRGQVAEPVRTRQLTSDDLRKLEVDGISVGNHSLTHPCLDKCDDATLQFEVHEAHARLTDLLGHPPESFAGFDHRMAAHNADPLTISRVRVDAGAGLDRFRIIVSGSPLTNSSTAWASMSTTSFLRDAAATVSPRHRNWRSLLKSLTLHPDALGRPVPAPGQRDFVMCGSARSGTALLVAALFQPPLVVTVMEPWDALRLQPQTLFESLRTEILTTHQLSRGRLDAGALQQSGSVTWCRDGERPHNLPNLPDDFLLGVKFPAFWRYLELLPDTRFLVCLRHPLEVVRSYEQTGGRLREGQDYDVPFNRVMNQHLLSATEDPAVRRVLLYAYIHQRILPHLDRPNVMAVRYERWFSAPNEQLAEISEFLGVRLDRSMVKLRAPQSRGPANGHESDLLRRHCRTAGALGYEH